MMDWYNFHPIIAPLPKGFNDKDSSHKEAQEWMNKATDEIERLMDENEKLQDIIEKYKLI